jgi:hypothetical protein
MANSLCCESSAFSFSFLLISSSIRSIIVTAPFADVIRVAADRYRGNHSNEMIESLFPSLPPSSSPISLYICQTPIQRTKDCQSGILSLDSEHSALSSYQSWRPLSPMQFSGALPTPDASSAPLGHLRADIILPPFLSQRSILSINFWLSAGQSVSNLHFDSYSNLLSVVSGEKTILLFPPSLTPLLLPPTLSHHHPHHSTLSHSQVTELAATNASGN